MPEPAHIVLYASPAALPSALASALLERGMRAQGVAEWNALLAALAETAPAALLFDLALSATADHAALRTLRQRVPELPILALDAQPSVAAAVACMKLGASEYLGLHGDVQLCAQALHDLLAHNVAAAPIRPLHEEERRAIERALILTDWNIVETAQRLAIGRATLYRRMHAWGLQRPITMVMS